MLTGLVRTRWHGFVKTVEVEEWQRAVGAGYEARLRKATQKDVEDIRDGNFNPKGPWPKARPNPASPPPPAKR